MISFDIAGTYGFSARVEMEETLDIIRDLQII